MRFFSLMLVVSALSSPFALAAQDAPVALVPAPQPTAPSSILKPAIVSIQQALATLRPDKWKVPGPLSQQTQNNITSIQNDLQTTLPRLLEAADPTPNSIVQVMPVFRNVTALYDVLLRVAVVASTSAPSQQIVALQDAMDRLDQSRSELGDGIQTSALHQVQQIRDLQAQLQALQSVPPPPPCPPPPAPPVKKRKPAAKPAPHPATAPATTPAVTPAAH